LPTPDSCIEVTIDFDTKNKSLGPGEYMGNQWAKFGVNVLASGGFGKLPCLFDTADPGSKETCGYSDRDAPNDACSSPGPGTGVGGEPTKLGANCDPPGNFLIIQEPGSNCPTTLMLMAV
jgi:hypothetical protein